MKHFKIFLIIFSIISILVNIELKYNLLQINQLGTFPLDLKIEKFGFIFRLPLGSTIIITLVIFLIYYIISLFFKRRKDA